MMARVPLRLPHCGPRKAALVAVLCVVVLACTQSNSGGAGERTRFSGSSSEAAADVKALCNEVAGGSESYLRATQIVSDLPEFKKWESSLPQSSKIWFGPMESQVIWDRKCFLPIVVYESQQTHLVRWNSFLVELSHTEILVMDTEGEYVPIVQWRESYLQQ
jgi:hypothetical protein